MKVTVLTYKTEINCREDPVVWGRHPSTKKVGTNFVDKRLPLSLYSSRSLFVFCFWEINALFFTGTLLSSSESVAVF
jgi:hypothetical protein